MKANRIRLAALVMAVSTAFAAGARGDDAAPAAAQSSPVFARVSVGSASQVAKLADDLGIPLPAMLTAAGVEQMFPFLGQGGMNPDLPVTMDFIADGTNLMEAQRQVWYLPINAGKVPISDFLANGEKMGDDGALVNGTPFRRTGDYLMFGGTSAAMAALKPADMLKSLSDHPLFYAEYDAKHLREIDPKKFAEMKKNSDETTKNAANPGQAAGSEMATQFMFGTMEKAIFRIDRTQAALKLSGQISPAPKFTSKICTLPGMPEGLAARADCQMPAGSMAAFIKWARQSSGDEQFFKDLPGATTPAKKDKFTASAGDALEAIFGGEQCSIGLGKSSDGGFVLNIATQATAPRNCHDDFQRAVENLSFTSGKKDEMKAAVWFTHTGLRVERLLCDDDEGKLDFVIDAVDVKGTRLLTLEKTANTDIEKLLVCKPAGTLSTAATGWLDLPALLEMRSSFGTPAPELTGAEVDLLNKVVAGQRISWTVSTHHDQLDMSIDLPMSLLKNAVANASQVAELAGRLKGN